MTKPAQNPQPYGRFEEVFNTQTTEQMIAAHNLKFGINLTEADLETGKLQARADELTALLDLKELLNFYTSNG